MALAALVGLKEPSNQIPHTEKPIRSILKSLSWRVLGTLDTILISYILTDRIEVALSIGSVELFTKMALYYGHERIWNYISIGKKK